MVNPLCRQTQGEIRVRESLHHAAKVTAQHKACLSTPDVGYALML